MRKYNLQYNNLQILPYRDIIIWFSVINYRVLALVTNDSKPASLLFKYAYEDFDSDLNLTSV